MPLSVMAGIGALEALRSPAAFAQTVPQPELPRESARLYNVLDFGARGDGKATDTGAIQAAIDLCATRGGTVVLPAGTFRVGAIELKSNVTLHLSAGATLLGTEDASQYHAVEQIPLKGDTTLKDGNWALLYAVRAKNVVIEGHGTINGQGALFRPGANTSSQPARLTGTKRPYHFLAYQCEGITIRDLSLIDSAYHSIRVIACTRVQIDGVYIHSRVNVNNDGFHFVSSKFVTIRNCTVLSQDDACALFGSCQFVTVTNCIFSTRWSVFRFGGGTVKNIAVSNCILFQVYGCPIKFQGVPGSRFENVSFSNLILDDVTGPIYLSTGPAANHSDADDPPLENGVKARLPAIVRNISFDNISGTVASAPRQLPESSIPTHAYPGEALSCVALSCPDGAVMEGISMSNIHLVFEGGGTKEDGERRNLPFSASEYFTLGTMPAYGLYARGVHGLMLQNVRLEVKTTDLRPAVILDRVKDAAMNGLTIQANPMAESALRFVSSEDVLLAQSRLLTKARCFLQIEGQANKAIVVDGGDFSKATLPVTFLSGAAKETVTMRE
jgi:hypothetical protein